MIEEKPRKARRTGLTRKKRRVALNEFMNRVAFIALLIVIAIGISIYLIVR